MDSVLDFQIPGWMNYIFLWYGGGFLAKHMGGLTVGNATIILTPIPFSPLFLLAEDSHWLLYIVAFIVSCALGFILYVFRHLENKFIQEKRDKKASDLLAYFQHCPAPKNKQLPIFSLYLRPFDITDHIATQSLGSRGDHEHIDMETMLDVALRPIAPLIALGSPGEMIGAGRIASSEYEWRQIIETLMNYSALIIIIPSQHTGTLWEIERIFQENYLEKTVWFMPETVTGNGPQFHFSIPNTFSYLSYEGYDFSGEWKSLRKTLVNKGFCFPPYDPSGMAFTINEDKEVEKMRTLSMSGIPWRMPKIRSAIINLNRSLKASISKQNKEKFPTIENVIILSFFVCIQAIFVLSAFYTGPSLITYFCFVYSLLIFFEEGLWNRLGILAQKFAERFPCNVKEGDQICEQSIFSENIQFYCIDDNFFIRMRGRREWSTILFAFIWITSVSFIDIAFYNHFSDSEHTSASAIFFGLFMLPFNIVSLFELKNLIIALLSAAIGETIETIGNTMKIDRGSIKIGKKNCFKVFKQDILDVTKIKNIRQASEDDECLFDNKNVGNIAIDLGQDPIYFGRSLNWVESEKICKILSKKVL